MKISTQLYVVVLALFAILGIAMAQPLIEEGNNDVDPAVLEDYNDLIGRLLSRTQKRSCVRRYGNCDLRPNDCCDQGSCRCNLWGSNCRCARAGLFQQWGK